MLVLGTGFERQGVGEYRRFSGSPKDNGGGKSKASQDSTGIERIYKVDEKVLSKGRSKGKWILGCSLDHPVNFRRQYITSGYTVPIQASEP
jgi:hypothetical protein